MFKDLLLESLNPYTGDTVHQIEFGSNPSYRIKDIAGLGPVKANVSMAGDGTEPGSIILGASEESRNIVLTIEFDPDYANGENYTDLRRELYKVAMPKARVGLDFQMSDLVGDILRITGIVETHEPTIFSANPQVQISIICPHPYFEKVQAPQVHSVPAGSASPYDVVYPGTVPVGFSFEFYVDANIIPASTLISLRDSFTGYSFMLQGKELLPGDRVTFNSRKGQRGIKLLRDAATSDLVSFSRGGLTAMKLQPGLNRFVFSARGGTHTRKFSWVEMVGGL